METSRMNKPIPAATFKNIRPPNKNYKYFEDRQHHPFLPLATTFELVNAGWMADFALLAYFKKRTIQKTFDDAGLTADGFVMEFFSRGITQCFVAHNNDFVVVSVRGTEIDNLWGAIVDWSRNFQMKPKPDASGGLVHEGFMKDVAEVWNDSGGERGLKSYLQPLLAGSRRTLWITGHSLGAAVATLVAERAVREAGFAVRGVYTFGSPRVGDIKFKQYYEARGVNAKTHRVVYDIDVAQRLFPDAAYTHVGQFVFIDAAGHLHTNLPEPPTEDFKIPRGFVANADRLIIPALIADHAPIYYASHIWNNQ
jgi:triacylglycerol lipase